MSIEADKALVDYNNEGIFENFYQAEKHSTEVDDVPDGFPLKPSHCIQKHLRTIRGEAREAQLHSASFDKELSKGYGEFKGEVEKVRRNNPTKSSLRPLRNKFRALIKDPTLSESCGGGICDLDTFGIEKSINTSNDYNGSDTNKFFGWPNGSKKIEGDLNMNEMVPILGAQMVGKGVGFGADYLVKGQVAGISYATLAKVLGGFALAVVGAKYIKRMKYFPVVAGTALVADGIMEAVKGKMMPAPAVALPAVAGLAIPAIAPSTGTIRID